MLSTNHTPLTTVLTALASTKQGLPVLEAALIASMRDTAIYAGPHGGTIQTCDAPSLAAAFHPHTLADAARLVSVAAGVPVSTSVLVYTPAGAWESPNTISINDAPEVDLTPWRGPVVTAAPPAPPAPPPAPTAVAEGLALPPALDGVLAQIEEAFGQPAPAPVERAVSDSEAIITEMRPGPTPSNVVAIKPAAPELPTPTGWEGTFIHPDLPLTRFIPTPTGDKGRPKASPFAKVNPKRSRVGAPSPFWRDLLPMAPGLFLAAPGDLVKNNNLGSQEAYAQLVHLVSVVLDQAPEECTVGHLRAYLGTIQRELYDIPSWPAIAHSQAVWNAASEGGSDE